jgi:hypothetical protein
MRKLLFIVAISFTVLTLSGCKDNTVIIPPDVMSREELVPILADLQIAQASLLIFEYSDTVQYSLKQYQVEILKKKNIPEDKFIGSMKFYADHPELLREIYEEVVNELSKRQGELETK